MFSARAWGATGPANMYKRVWMAGEFQNAKPPHTVATQITTGIGAGLAIHRSHKMTIVTIMPPIPALKVRSAPHLSVAIPPNQIPRMPAIPDRLNANARSSTPAELVESR